MIRPVLTEVGVFLIPFAVYAIFLAKLVLGSLLLVVISFVLLAHFSGAAPNSTYFPAHVENGKFIPGIEK
jgi:hypothetical protein